jgi:hypothetical protein
VRLVGRVQVTSDGGETLTAADGPAEASVAKVVIARSSGGDVTATVKGGYWVAWWPGDAAFEKATAFAADGSEIGSIAVGANRRGRGPRLPRSDEGLSV